MQIATSQTFHPSTHDWSPLGAHPEDVVHTTVDVRTYYGAAVAKRMLRNVTTYVDTAVTV